MHVFRELHSKSYNYILYIQLYTTKIWSKRKEDNKNLITIHIVYTICGNVFSGKGEQLKRFFFTFLLDYELLPINFSNFPINFINSLAPSVQRKSIRPRHLYKPCAWSDISVQTSASVNKKSIDKRLARKYKRKIYIKLFQLYLI